VRTNNIVIAVRLDLSDMDDDEKLDFVDETSRTIEDYIVKNLYRDKSRVIGYSMVHTMVGLGQYQQAHTILGFIKYVMACSNADKASVLDTLRAKLDTLAEETGLDCIFGRYWDDLE